MAHLCEEIGVRKAGWVVYLLRCGDGSLYTGITNDLTRRLRQHQEGKGARYTRGRGPLTLVYIERFATRGEALRREAAIKRLSTRKKQELVRAWEAVYARRSGA